MAFFISGSSGLFAQTDENMYQAKVRAPELTGGKSWLNTDKPLSIAGLKGKVVLLDFWTYGCINCIHIIPDLKKLEAKYEKNLVVIGVHSAKFENEGETENIRKIILRYNIEHPVVNDSEFKIWNQYAVNAYPTRILIDPSGYVVGKYVGEGYFEEITADIEKVLTEAKKKGNLDETPLKLALERAKVGDLPLAFPGKILADTKLNRLFIADSNHNRIVVTDLNGKLMETIGSGEISKKDGDFQTAGFFKPQGMAIDGENLYVADTDNQTIRKIDLKNKTVSTIAGTGTIEGFTGEGGDALKTSLRSPWDLSLVGEKLFIAMAGSHQIWLLNLKTKQVQPYAGTRREARTDGKLTEAAFAQPSGIASDGKNLFVADSESNIIRDINFQKETVETLVGGDLYDFGDADGEGDDVRLQHPLGIVIDGGQVLLADTYNHKIKLLNPLNKTVTTFLGNGKSGQTDGANPQFYEPGGLSIADGKLFIADTNNHAIRVADLKTKTVSTLKIEGLTPPKINENQTESFSPNLKEFKSEVQNIATDKTVSISLNIKLPEGYHLNENAPNRFEVTSKNDSIKFENRSQKYKTLPISIPFQTLKTGTTDITAKISIFYCREDNTGECLIKTLVWQIPVKISNEKTAASKIELNSSIEK
ncbi:MAG: thioredoxin-like domain-containing protein [Pyrinomonadaceae bacterium]